MLATLKCEREIYAAREELERRSLSALDSPLERRLKKLRLKRGAIVGDLIKSWDVNKTVLYVEEQLSKSGSLLDIGCFSCEILPILHRLGFTNLTGIDLNPQIKSMPYNDCIRYMTGDFMRSELADASVDCVTAISVIEHGLRPADLFREMARIMRPGGKFVASFDYWPEKIDTRAQPLFGMSWDILSASEVKSLVAVAANCGFRPAAALDFSVGESPIRFGGHKYTFGWLALTRE